MLTAGVCRGRAAWKWTITVPHLCWLAPVLSTSKQRGRKMLGQHAPHLRWLAAALVALSISHGGPRGSGRYMRSTCASSQMVPAAHYEALGRILHMPHLRWPAVLLLWLAGRPWWRCAGGTPAPQRTLSQRQLPAMQALQGLGLPASAGRTLTVHYGKAERAQEPRGREALRGLGLPASAECTLHCFMAKQKEHRSPTAEASQGLGLPASAGRALHCFMAKQKEHRSPAAERLDHRFRCPGDDADSNRFV